MSQALVGQERTPAKMPHPKRWSRLASSPMWGGSAGADASLRRRSNLLNLGQPGHFQFITLKSSNHNSVHLEEGNGAMPIKVGINGRFTVAITLFPVLVDLPDMGRNCKCRRQTQILWFIWGACVEKLSVLLAGFGRIGRLVRACDPRPKDLILPLRPFYKS